MTLSGIADLAKLCVYLIPIPITILMNLINRYQKTVILDTTYQTFIKHKLFCKHKLVKNNTIRVIPIILNFLLIYLEHLNKMSQFYTHLQTHPNPHIFTFQKPIRKNTKLKIFAISKINKFKQKHFLLLLLLLSGDVEINPGPIKTCLECSKSVSIRGWHCGCGNSYHIK